MRKNRAAKSFDLRAWRKAMGMTQKAAAEFLDYSPSYYRELEYGNRPHHQLLAPACEYFLLVKSGNLKNILSGIK